jgi:hypothetical protein
MSAFRPVESQFLVFAARTAQEAMDIAARAFGVTIPEIASKGRSRARVAYSRQVAMYLCHVIGRMSLTEISIAFERDRTTVAHACHAIEDRRESEICDRQIAVLESHMRERMEVLLRLQRMRTRPPPDAPPPRRPLDGEDRDSRVRRVLRPRVKRRRPRSR